MAVEPKISRLKTLLMNTGLQQKDNKLFQVIDGLITMLRQDQIAVGEQISESASGLAGGPYLTHTTSTILTSSKVLLAGANVSFVDASTTRTINVTTFASTTEPYLTHTTAAGLANSKQLLAGTNIAFVDDTTSRTISAVASGNTTATYLTHTSEVSLPNSRVLVAGTNVSFDNSIGSQKIINVDLASLASLGAHIYLTSDTTVATTDLPKIISFQAAAINESNYWSSTQPTRITIPTPGWYALNAQISDEIGTNAASLLASVRLNGGTTVAEQETKGETSIVPNQVGLIQKFVAGDYLELILNSNGVTNTVKSGQYATFIEIAQVKSGSGGGSEWDVLTNGDSINPELIFADGEVVMLET